MGEFAFKANIVAVVRVHAADENVAREVVPNVLGAPGTVEIELANANHAAVGCAATVIDIEFSVGSIKLVEGRSDLSGTDAAAVPVRADSSRRKESPALVRGLRASAPVRSPVFARRSATRCTANKWAPQRGRAQGTGMGRIG
jgi:hypothetical protein